MTGYEWAITALGWRQSLLGNGQRSECWLRIQGFDIPHIGSWRFSKYLELGQMAGVLRMLV